jgi:mitotic spindle assembly checkpoint protein MAD2
VGTITLKGSAEIVGDALYHGISNVLYQRGIYGDDQFTWINKYGVRLPQIMDEGVVKILQQQIAQIKAWLISGDIKRVVLVIHTIETDDTLERYTRPLANPNNSYDDLFLMCYVACGILWYRWSFDIEKDEKAMSTAPTTVDNGEVKYQVDTTKVNKQIAAVMRQIFTSFTFLPAIDVPATFDILCYTSLEASVPKSCSLTPTHVVC